MTELIALDWGTTSLRAYRAAGDAVVERRESPSGILRVENGDFPGTLSATVGDWLTSAPGAAVIMAGMIGSRQGWREVPYVPCPADAAALARGLGRIDGAIDRPVHIVPGIISHDGGVPDVIRGEETQIVGECAARVVADGLFVLPGTHSKWALVERGRITAFRTAMTGELFDVLRRHSILGRMIEGDAHDPAAFARGLDHGGRADLGHAVFAARTLPLTGALPPTSVASFLSGVLVAGEVAGARTWSHARGMTAAPVVIGSGTLTDRYLEALGHLGHHATGGTPDAAVLGLVTLARSAGLIGAPR